VKKPAALLIGGSQRTRDSLAQHFEVLGQDDLPNRGAEIAYFLWQGHGGCDAALMDQMPGLKIISNYGVGYDAVDVAAAKARGVMVTHTPNVLNDEVANTAVMLLLMVMRNALADADYLAQGRWAAEGEAPLSRGIAGRKVGILGLGRIGKVLVDKLGVFGVEISYHGRSQQDVPLTYHPTLEQMAEAVDVLISIAPGGAATHHLINAKVLEALGPEVVLINIGRGSVVHEAALVDALQAGRLGAAGLDVFEHEPHVPPALIELPNVTCLPHVGSATVETRNAMSDLAVENLVQFLATGRPVTPVPEYE
jgi:lactate dehydrogenase-like 2-hydroxyacid dehydrogenase